MCLCLLLIIIDRGKGMPFITSFPEFVISFFFRSSFAIPSLFLRSSYSRRNGFTADLQRNYNGLAYERENALAIFQ
jgi:ABC-type microcin C transport system permease subunit YejB